MSDPVIDALRGANPYPEELAAPPIEPLLGRLSQAGAPPPQRPSRRPHPGTVTAMVSGGLAVAIAVFALTALRHDPVGPGARATAGTPATAGRAARLRPVCRPQVRVRVLPVWARAGFSEARPRMAFALGAAGRIGAIVWAGLSSPPPASHNNKILWVARVPPTSYASLRISAQRMRGARRIGAPVSRTVAGGPGPSIINLPEAGCWRFTLRWGRSSDALDLSYAGPQRR